LLSTPLAILKWMKPETVGRTFGIGLRVAGKALAASLEGSQSPSQSASAVNEAVRSTQAATEQMRAAATQVRTEVARTRTALVGKAARGTGRGVGGFLRPFARIGGILWLEVTGAIFFLIVLFVAQNLWRVRDSYASGPNHGRFLLIAALLVLFLYLGVSAFWRARRR
jgi:hypothetical protein